jgi:hypothetical protein
MSDEWKHDGPSLGADGKIVGAPGRTPEPATQVPEEKLELDTSRMHRSDGTWVEPAAYREDVSAHRRRATAIKAIAILAVLGVAAAVAFVRIPFLHAIRLQGAAKPLLVMSTPSGAAVRINGAVVGTTPFAADNRYVGKVTVSVTLEGYEPFTESFEGGREVEVAATLRKKK